MECLLAGSLLAGCLLVTSHLIQACLDSPGGDLHPGIEAAAVVAMPDPRLGEKACAYVTLRHGNNLSLEKVVLFLKERGAGKLLMPERLEILDDLPKTLVGKVDKKALRCR